MAISDPSDVSGAPLLVSRHHGDIGVPDAEEATGGRLPSENKWEDSSHTHGVRLRSLGGEVFQGHVHVCEPVTDDVPAED